MNKLTPYRKRCLAFLVFYKDVGISAKDLGKRMHTNATSIHSLISSLRMKEKFVITTTKGKYFIQSISDEILKNLPKVNPLLHPAPSATNTSTKSKSNTDTPFPFPVPIGNVPPEQKTDFVDYLLQAKKYYLLAVQIIEDSKLRQQLLNPI